MIYVSILKNRGAELTAVKKCKDCLGTYIIPLFEIIKDDYTPRYKTDEKGNVLKEIKPGNKRATPIRLKKSDEDICTLDTISNAVGDSKCFIEFFRFTINDYPSQNMDIQNVDLARKLSNSFKDYSARTLEICEYSNFIPVISIKKSFLISESDLINMINEIRSRGNVVAVRINIDQFDSYQAFLEDNLIEADYLLVDIGESPFISQEFLLQDVFESNVKANRILLNSPRKKDIPKKEFQLDGWEPLINNDVARGYSEYGFSGYGDYAGLKDSLPQIIRSGKIYILALIYDFDSNRFWSIRSEKVQDALGVKNKALKHSSFFDSQKSCRAYLEINRINSGTQAKWNEITVIRYIHQVFTKMDKDIR